MHINEKFEVVAALSEFLPCLFFALKEIAQIACISNKLVGRQTSICTLLFDRPSVATWFHTYLW